LLLICLPGVVLQIIVWLNTRRVLERALILLLLLLEGLKRALVEHGGGVLTLRCEGRCLEVRSCSEIRFVCLEGVWLLLKAGWFEAKRIAHIQN